MRTASDRAAAHLVRRHLDLRSAAVVAGIVRLVEEAVGHHLLSRDEVERRFPFLTSPSDLLRAVAGQPVEDDQQTPDQLRRLAADVATEAVVTTGQPPPLNRVAELVARSGGDGDLAADVVAAAALVERDARFGAVFAGFQAPTGARRPCLGLLATLLDRHADRVAETVAVLTTAGIVVVEHADEPRAEQTVRVPPPVLGVLEGSTSPGLDLTSTADAPALDDLILPAELQHRLARAAAMLATGDLAVLVVRGAAGTGRRTALRAVAGALHRGLLVAAPPPGSPRRGPGAEPDHRAGTGTGTRPPTDGIPGAVALLAGSMLTWAVEPGLGELVEVPRPVDGSPLGVVTGPRGAVLVDGGERVAVVDLPTPGPPARRRFWTGAGLHASPEVVDEVSRRFVLSGGTIGRVASVAQALALLDGRDHVEVDDVRQAAQDHGRQRLESLAGLLPRLPGDLDPVLSGAAAEAYEALVLRARHREGLADAVGGAAGGEITRGVKALLSGPSGTGKTLTARAVGRRLGLDVYRADLAALVDKYIGETERRLDTLFGVAEEIDVVLLIDEGDAFMTRRTDVRSSNDRYANLETDFLLQRLEVFQGIVLVTTNAPHLVDTAFQRRLDVTISFGPPGPADRRLIWQRHLPGRHAVTAAALDRLAGACRLTGGQIRNAAVHAALLALERDHVVDDATLTVAAEREVTLAGRSSPLARPAAVVSPFERAEATR